jgi:hypothetical protein
MGNRVSAIVGYNGTLDSLKHYVTSNTQFENDYYVRKKFRYNISGTALEEAFSRIQNGDEYFDLEIEIQFFSPDFKTEATSFTIFVHPKILDIYFGYYVDELKNGREFDLYKDIRSIFKRYPKRIVKSNFIIRQTAVSVAKHFNQNIILYMGDQGEIVEEALDHIEDPQTDIHTIIKILKEKHALAPLSNMWGFGGVPLVFYETLDSTTL